jgi:hypothetical protein
MDTKLLFVPRGTPDLATLTLEMAPLYYAESRLFEVAAATPAKAPELMSTFNEACNTTSKYLAWIEYELLQGEKFFNLAKATVILEKAPEEFKKYRDTGIKFNEDFREALIARDMDCQKRLDALNGIKAVRALLESKVKSFERAYYATREIAKSRDSIAASPNFSGAIGRTDPKERE